MGKSLDGKIIPDNSTIELHKKFDNAMMAEDVKTVGNEMKNGTKLKLAIILLLFLALGGFIFGLYEMLKPVQDCGCTKYGERDSIESLEGSESDRTECNCSECENITKVFIIPPDEMIIEDSSLLEELSKKVSWLNDVWGVGEEEMFIKTLASYNAVESTLYAEPLSGVQKAVIATKMAFDTENKVLGNKKDAVFDEIQKHYDKNLPGNYNVKERKITEISFSPYSLANDYYHELFGYEDDIPKEYLHGTCMEQFLYLNTLDGFTNLADGCGGAGWSEIYVRKDYLTEKNDEAFVYTRVASRLVDNVLCNDFVERGANGSGCKLGITEVNASDLDNAAVYRFSFKKNSAGTYSFVKVEKI